jgi:hypothetical protein
MNTKLHFIKDSSSVVSDDISLNIRDDFFEMTINKTNATVPELDSYKYLDNLLRTHLFYFSNKQLDVLKLLSKEQKESLYEFLLKRVLQLSQEINEEKTDNLNLKCRIESCDKKIQELEDRLTSMRTRTDSLEYKIQELEKKRFNAETAQPLPAVISTTPIDFDYVKVKRTLNLMMELWESGTDFSTVLLRARSYMQLIQSTTSTTACINSTTTINLNNFRLDYSNNGVYVGSQSARIFERFDNV